MQFHSKFASLTFLLAAPFAHAGLIDLTCPGNAASCNDTFTSLGMAVVRITDPAVIAAFASSPPAGYDPVTHDFVTPLLFDSATLVGRTAPFAGGSAADTGDPPVLPAGFPTGNNDETHTSILSLNLAGGGFAVQAGSAITAGTPNSGHASPGEVESIACHSIANGVSAATCGATGDYPANSFFDVFTNLVTPFGSFYNFSALVVQNAVITALPPTVVYVHGVSTVVPIFADANNAFEVAGTHLGDMILTGHGAGFCPTNSPPAGQAPCTPTAANNTKAFGQQMLDIIAGDPGLSGAEQNFISGQVTAATGATPEPSTVALTLSGLAALGWRARRRGQK